MAGKVGFRWPRPQFSLATFLIFVTAISPLIVYVAQRRSYNDRRKAALEIFHRRSTSHMELYLCAVFLDRALQNEPWSVKRWWDDLCHEDRTIHLEQFQSSGAISSEEVKLLTLFPELSEVDIVFNSMDDQLKPLARLPHLRKLRIRNSTTITGEYLRDFVDCNSIECIAIDHMEALRGESLAPLSRFRRLTELQLYDCETLTGQSLREVSLPPTLENLTLFLPDVGDDTIARWLAQTTLVELKRSDKHPLRIFMRESEIEKLTEANSQ